MKSPYESPKSAEPKSQTEDQHNKMSSVFITVAIFTLMAVTYKLIVSAGKEQTSLLFIGIPAILAVLLSKTKTPGSATGKIMKGTTLCILIVGILVGEGIICLLIASPLFFLVGAFIGWLIDRNRTSDTNTFRSFAIVALAATCLEGMTDALSFDREEVVSAKIETSLSAAEVRAKLAQGPEFDLSELPTFLKLGFPTPQSIEGGDLAVGNRWTIHFAGGEGEPGNLVMQVVESNEQTLRLICIEDSSHIAHWLDWKDAVWTFTETSAGTTVEMTLSYDRQLDPAWYFKPTERYGVRKAAEYFLQQTFKADE